MARKSKLSTFVMQENAKRNVRKTLIVLELTFRSINVPRITADCFRLTTTEIIVEKIKECIAVI